MGSEYDPVPMRYFFALEEERTRVARACAILRDAAVGLNNASDILKHTGASIDPLREMAQAVRDFESRVLRERSR